MSEESGAPAGGDRWGEAAARGREDVRRAFAPRPRRCESCGATSTTASRTCPRCGAPYVSYRPARWTRRTRRLLAGTIIAAAVLGAVGFVVLGPSIRHTKGVHSARARADLARARAAERARLTRLQRVHVARVPAARDLAARRALVARLPALVMADARERVRLRELPGPVRSTECEPFPSGSRDAAGEPAAAVGRYVCTAVISRVSGGRGAAEQAVIGNPFWARVWFTRGAYAWCAITPRGGERVAGLELATVPLAPACDLGDDTGDTWPPQRRPEG